MSATTAANKRKQADSGPVLDWSAGHGPVTGALSATTGALAIATTGAATGMPPMWAMAVGGAGALGHTVAGLKVRNAGRTLAFKAASWLVGAGWTTWAITTGPSPGPRSARSPRSASGWAPAPAPSPSTKKPARKRPWPRSGARSPVR